MRNRNSRLRDPELNPGDSVFDGDLRRWTVSEVWQAIPGVRLKAYKIRSGKDTDVVAAFAILEWYTPQRAVA